MRNGRSAVHGRGTCSVELQCSHIGKGRRVLMRVGERGCSADSSYGWDSLGLEWDGILSRRVGSTAIGVTVAVAKPQAARDGRGPERVPGQRIASAH